MLRDGKGTGARSHGKICVEPSGQRKPQKQRLEVGMRPAVGRGAERIGDMDSKSRR